MRTPTLLRYPTDGRRLAVLHGLLLVMHLLLHLHETVIVLLKLLVLGETLLVLHSHQVQGINAGWEVAATQDSLVVRD